MYERLGKTRNSTNYISDGQLLQELIRQQISAGTGLELRRLRENVKHFKVRNNPIRILLLIMSISRLGKLTVWSR